MGTCASAEYKRLEEEDGRISMQLLREERESSSTMSILLQGTSGSGKSTIMKQFKLHKIYNEPSTTQEREQELQGYIPMIHKQCIEQMRIALTTRHEIISLVYGFSHNIQRSVRNERISLIIPDDVQRLIFLYFEVDLRFSLNANMAAECIQNKYCSVDEFNDEIVEALKTLWNEPAIKTMHERRRNDTGIDDSTDYFWNMLDRLNDPEYVPKSEDLLRINDNYSTKGMSFIQYRCYQ